MFHQFKPTIMTTTTTAINTTTNVFVVLHPHSEYNGFSVYGGVFKTKEAAIADFMKRNSKSRYPIIETLIHEHNEETYVIPITNRYKDNIEQIREDFNDDMWASEIAYDYGGLLILETKVG